MLSLQHNNRVYVDNANWHSSTPGGVRWQRGCGGCQQGLGGGGGAVKASSTRPHHADKCTRCDSRPGHHAFAPQTTAQQRRQTAAPGHTASVGGLYTHTFNAHTFNGPFSRTIRVGRYQKGKTKLDFTEARDSEWQWHQLGHMQVCTSFHQTDNHASTSPLHFLQARCPSCRPTNSVKALKATTCIHSIHRV